MQEKIILYTLFSTKNFHFTVWKLTIFLPISFLRDFLFRLLGFTITAKLLSHFKNHFWKR